MKLPHHRLIILLLYTIGIFTIFSITACSKKEDYPEPVTPDKIFNVFVITTPVSSQEVTIYPGENRLETLRLFIFDGTNRLEYTKLFNQTNLKTIITGDSITYAGFFEINSSSDKRTICFVGNEPSTLDTDITTLTPGNFTLEHLENIHTTGATGQFPNYENDSIIGKIPFTMKRYGIILNTPGDSIALNGLTRAIARIDPIIFKRDVHMDEETEIRINSVTLTRMRQSRLMPDNPLMATATTDIETISLFDEPAGVMVGSDPIQITQPVYLWEDYNTTDIYKTRLTINWTMDRVSYQETCKISDVSGSVSRNHAYQPTFNITKEKKSGRLHIKVARK